VVTHIWESRQFESMYTLQGKTRPTRHLCFPHQFTYARCTLPAGGPRTEQPFLSRQQSWEGSLLPRNKAPNTTARRLIDPRVRTQLLLPSQPMKQWRQRQTSINGRLLGLLGLYHQHAIGTFNTCSRVPTPRSLTDTGGGYHIENPLNGPARFLFLYNINLQ
jgi:hypothetical protein